VVDYLRAYVDAGCQHITMRINTINDYDRIQRAIAEEVVPAIHELETV